MEKLSHDGEGANIDMTQLHPYQYLTQLNSIYASCNKANAKSFSSVSKIKLEWKPFSIMKIPHCFQQTYTHSHQNAQLGKCDAKESIENTQKKIWREHHEILKRYIHFKSNHHSNRVATTLGRSKSACRKFPQALSGVQQEMSSSSGINSKSRVIVSVQQKYENNQNKSNPNKNKENSDPSCFQHSNLLIKKMRNKGMHILHDRQDVKKEVLSKLKLINSQRRTQNSRIQSAQKIRGKGKKGHVEGHHNQQNWNQNWGSGNQCNLATPAESQEGKQRQIYWDQRPYLGKERQQVSKDQYLEFEKSSDIIARYKGKIREVDCAISECNVKKAGKILRNMEEIVHSLA